MRGMKDSGIEWIGEIPNDWEVKKIASVYKERTEKVSDKDYEPLSVTKKGVVPQLENAAKTTNGDNRKLVKKGDFAINSRSDRRGSCGISPLDGSVSLIMTVLKPRNNMDNKYYNYVFRSERFSDEFYKWGHGIVDDLWSTKWEDMKRIFIPFPNKEEQELISDYLDEKVQEIDNIISKTHKIIEEYKKYKQSVITEAVTKGLNPNVEMKDSEIEWIGEIPKDWILTITKHTYNVTLGKMICNEPKDDSYTYENYLCSQNIKWEGIQTSDIKKMWFSKNEKERYLLQYGDILVTEGGSIGVSSVYKNEFYPCYIQNAVHKVSGKKNSLNKFFYYWMTLVESCGYLDLICNKATIAHYTKEKLQNTPILKVPLKEQAGIVNYLDKKCTEIDNLITKKQELITQLETYKKSLIYECVTGKKEVALSYAY